MNTYYLRARLFPSVITIIPFFIATNSIVVKNYDEELSAILEVLPILTSLGISLALIFLLTQINRILSKEIFQRFYFKEETNMPTTNFLLWEDDTFEEQIKKLIYEKIHSKYDITLMLPDEEIQDEGSARKRIVAAVSQIRNGLRSNELLFQHNIEYGFFRNLLGGSVIAFMFSLAIIAYSHWHSNENLFTIGIFLSIIYLLPILLSKKILSIFGKNYAKILYEQFLSQG